MSWTVADELAALGNAWWQMHTNPLPGRGSLDPGDPPAAFMANPAAYIVDWRGVDNWGPKAFAYAVANGIVPDTAEQLARFIFENRKGRADRARWYADILTQMGVLSPIETPPPDPSYIPPGPESDRLQYREQFGDNPPTWAPEAPGGKPIPLNMPVLKAADMAPPRRAQAVGPETQPPLRKPQRQMLPARPNEVQYGRTASKRAPAPDRPSNGNELVALSEEETMHLFDLLVQHMGLPWLVQYLLQNGVDIRPDLQRAGIQT